MTAAATNVRVTAVIPAYNAEKFIAEALQSVLDQTVEIAEIIVVDDGSSDRTAEVAATFPRTRVIRQPNAGCGAARNTALRVATGEWIALLDADDIWLPEKTERQQACIAPGVGVVHTNRFDPVNFGNLWHRQAFVTPSGAFIRKQALLDVGGFEESPGVIDDITCWLKIALTDWRFVPSAENQLLYRPTEQSLSASELKMIRRELAGIEMVGTREKCQPLEIERIKQASKIEYAKNLIAAQRWDEAAQLLAECTPGLASRWLTLARLLRVNRLARTNLVRWMHSLDGNYSSHTCSGECTLPEAHRIQCMNACHKPYFIA